MDPLRKKYDEVAGTIGELKQTAGDRWKTLEAAKKAVADAPEPPKSTDDPLMKALSDADKAYGEVADQIAAAESVKTDLMNALARTGDAPVIDDGSGGGKSGDDVRDRDGRRLVGEPSKRIIDSDAYKGLVASGELTSSAALGVKRLGEALKKDEFKALLTGAADLSGGAFITPDRIGYYPLPLRPITLLDLITVGDTTSDLVEYVRQTSVTIAAGNVPEATDVTGTSGTKPQSDMAFDVVQTGVKQIAHWMAATRRALADVGQLRTIIDQVLRYGLDRRLEDQVLAGDGTGENLRGILNTTGLQSVPAGPQSHADKVHFGITKVLLANFQATGVVMNPLDWETIRLSREDTGGPGTGAYIFGPPSQAGVETLWGRAVAQSPAIPQGTALVGDLRAAILWVREGVQILASDSHADFFIRNLVAVLAENRAAFGVPYPQAIAEVDLAAA
jgi:HK97 family phage major capsid protein